MLLRAAVIGKTFWRGVLGSIGDAAGIDDALDVLETRGLIQRQGPSGFAGDVEFSFKHELILETEGLTKDFLGFTSPHESRTLLDPLKKAASGSALTSRDVLPR